MMQWLLPWKPIANLEQDFRVAIAKELQRELRIGHPLHGIDLSLYAQGAGNDVLVELLDGTGRYALIHLTWSRRAEKPPYPYTEFYSSIDRFQSERMVPDHSNILHSKGAYILETPLNSGVADYDGYSVIASSSLPGYDNLQTTNGVEPNVPSATSEKAGPSQTVILLFSDQLRYPQHCVLCGKFVSELYSYQQDDAPAMLPGFVITQTTSAAVPYCSVHRTVFEERFKKLRKWQTILFIAMGASILASRLTGELFTENGPNWIPLFLFGVSLTLLLALGISIFLVKPRLYDVTFQRMGKYLKIKSRYRAYINEVRELNQSADE